MGNTHTSKRGVGRKSLGGSRNVVTVLQGDGQVMEFSRPMRVGDLLSDFPKHFVCHSSALVLTHQGKMLASDTPLVRGEVYFLLPLPSGSPSKAKSKSKSKSKTKSSVVPLFSDGDNADMEVSQRLTGLSQQRGPQAPQSKPSGTMRFLITKQQLAKILSEGVTVNVVAPPQKPTEVVKVDSNRAVVGPVGTTLYTGVRVLHRSSPPLVRKGVAWSPALESISEVPIM